MERSWRCWVSAVLLAGFASAAADRVALWNFDDIAGWDVEVMAGPLGWSPVHQTTMPSDTRPFPSTPYAMYFGDPRAQSYDAKTRVRARLWSPWIWVGPGGEVQPEDRLQLKFKYFRVVEQYTGPYDKTLILLVFWDEEGRQWDPDKQTWRFAGGGMIYGAQVFYCDSSTPSERKWLTHTSAEVPVPKEARWMKVVFEFDSVDHVDNDYLGWLIDDVELLRTPAPLVIATTELPEGRVDWGYWAKLEAKGGTPPYSWALASGSQLPRGLVLNRETGEISGTPTEAVEKRSLTFRVTDSARRTAEATLTLTIRPALGSAIPVYGYSFAGGLGEWEKSGLWNHAKPPGANQAGAYYGIQYGIPGAWNYDTGARTYGYLRSPEIDVADHAGKEFSLIFSYARDVEHHSGSYDRTYVQVSFYDGTKWSEWTTIWSKDSRDPNEWWLPYLRTDERPFDCPRGAKKMRIQFVFDSVDGLNNHFRGWFIGAVGVNAHTGPLQIETEELPSGELGAPYSFSLKAKGGTPPYEWMASGLPEGLSLDRWTGRISGIPRASGTFNVSVTVRDRAGLTDSRSYRLTISSTQVTLFFEDFEDPQWIERWEARTGLWQRTNEVRGAEGQNLAKDQGFVAYYGRIPEYNYDTGTRTRGELASRPFPLEGAKYVKVVFSHWREVESYGGAYDQTIVQVRFDSGEWQTVWYRDASTPSEKAWQRVETEGIAVPAGATHMQIRFVFDSVDRFNNKFTGWLVDEIRVVKSETGKSLATAVLPEPVSREAFTVVCRPNPVRDVHTATFIVQGVAVERIRVEVYDLSGRMVWAGEAIGNELRWHTQDLAGQFLANGVFLYKVYAQIGLATLVAGPQKLVILR